MNDPETFLTRWSRRKRGTVDESGATSDRPPTQQADIEPKPAQAVDGASPQAQAAKPESAEPEFDLSSLPSIDSITAETDISAFFAPGVPAELRVAALRRAWVVDPKVRDFIGLADYDWDFHTPGALEGFGPLEMTDELRREVMRILGEWQDASEPVTPPPTTVAPATPAAPAAPSAVSAVMPTEAGTDQRSVSENSGAQDQDELIGSNPTSQRSKVFAATRQEQSSQDELAMPARRSHGRALPK
jgi:hypothetical protein